MIRPKILVAESETSAARFIQSSLESAGFQVVQAVDGNTGWTIIQGQKLAVAFLAANLPGLNSREILLRVRADSNMADLPILILGESRHAEESVEWLTLGADDYVSKPVSARLLIALVHAKIRRSEKYRALDEDPGAPSFKIAHTGTACGGRR